MKQLITVILALVFVLSLSGCGAEEPASDLEYIEKNGKPEISGWSWIIDVNTVVESGDCNDTKLFMLTELFPLAQEYKAMREYTVEMQKKLDKKHQTTDWFDNL